MLKKGVKGKKCARRSSPKGVNMDECWLWYQDAERTEQRLTSGVRGVPYIADLILCFLDSLHLGRIRDHGETFSFNLLKLLLVVNLQEKKNETFKLQIKSYTS